MPSTNPELHFDAKNVRLWCSLRNKLIVNFLGKYVCYGKSRRVNERKCIVLRNVHTVLVICSREVQ